MRISPTPTRRNVVLDIETLSLDPTDPKGRSLPWPAGS
jgi:hypothetical protein